MDEYLTMAEIESRFPNEWILIEDPQTDENQQVLAGTVRCHSPERDEVYSKAVELRLPRCATHFTGRVPARGAIVL
jgi:hypothetical protein